MSDANTGGPRDAGQPRATPLVETIIGDRVVVVRHAEVVNLSGARAGSPTGTSSTSPLPAGAPKALRRAIAGGARKFRVGELVVEIGSVGAMHTHVHETHVTHALPDVEALLAALREIQREVETNQSLRSLQTYMAALRQSCASAPYVSLRASRELVRAYVPLSGDIVRTGGQPVEVPDVVEQVGAWLSSDPGCAVYIEGAPGSGKTTALHRLASSAWDDPGAVGLTRPHLPMLVRLRHLSKQAGANAEERLWGAVRAAGETMIAGDVPARGFMADWSHRMDAPWIILLDAFDELPKREMPSLRLWIASLMSLDGHRVVIATRQFKLLGGTPLLDRPGARSVSIGALPPDRQQLLSSHILRDRADDFWAAVQDAGLAATLNTPFDVAIVAVLYLSGQALPQSRAHLIRRFIESALEEAQLQYFDEEIDGDAVEPALEQIALDSMSDAGATSETALDAVVDVLAEEPRNQIRPSRIESAAQRLLDAVATRSGIFRIDAGLLVWSHALFGDLLAALAVARRFGPDSADGLRTALDWFVQERRTALFFLLAIWSDRRGFGLRGPTSRTSAPPPAVQDATAPMAAILDDQEPFNPDCAGDLSGAFIEGARASEALEQRIVDLMTADTTPFAEYRACRRVFKLGPDKLDAIEALGRLPRFRPRFDKLAERAREWVRSSDDDWSYAGASVLGFTGRWRELLAAAGDAAISADSVAAGARKLAEIGLETEASDVMEAVREREAGPDADTTRA